MKNVVISLFDYTGNMVRPWAEAGYECWCLDIQHQNQQRIYYGSGGEIRPLRADLMNPREILLDEIRMMAPRIRIGFAFPPCTDLAVSGARHFKRKGLGKLIDALTLFKVAVDLFEDIGCPYMIENPVSTVSTYWRKPDHIFHPHQYTGLCAEDNYTKKTCLWTGGFVMPDPCPDLSLGKPDDRIHKAPPGPDRANFRSATPMGFARAAFEANHRHFDILTETT